MLALYDRSLRTALRQPALVMLSLAATIGLAVYLFTIIPKGFFPEQDTGRMIGGIQADQSISFQLMEKKLTQFVDIIRHDPAVANVVGFTGGGQTNSGFIFVVLKPLSERKISVTQVIGRLRPKLNQVAGARLFLQAVQDIWVGGRQSNAQYQYTLQGDDSQEIFQWAPKVEAAMEKIPLLTEVNLDQQQNGLESDLVIDRATAARLGLNVSEIDNTLYDAFGQRQVSVIYAAQNQYHVVMEVAPQYWQNPQTLRDIYVSTAGGTVSGTQSTNAVAGTVSAVATSGNAATITTNNAVTAVTVNAATPPANNTVTPATNNAASPLVNNAAPNAPASASASAVASDTARNQANNSLAHDRQRHRLDRSARQHRRRNHGAAVGDRALRAGRNAARRQSPGTVRRRRRSRSIWRPAFRWARRSRRSTRRSRVSTCRRPFTASFQGTAKVFEQSLANEPILIAAALVAVYIVLGVLYESYIHPLTILSTLPSAGVGAVLALMLTDTDFSIIALIGVILLIGIVKKNAIMMIDFALDAERTQGLGSREAIYQACLKRFRPIMMTTLAAMLGAVPLAIGFGEGAELRRPLGISIVGGLMVSQVLTLYTTPVIYLYLDRFRLWGGRRLRFRHRRFGAGHLAEPGE